MDEQGRRGRGLDGAVRRERAVRRGRVIRLALALGATVATTALVGFGGLAAWQAYTDNANNQAAASSLGHTNTAAGATCTSVVSTGQLNQVGNTCGTVITVTGVNPSSPATLASGSVTIASTGQLTSTFQLGQLSVASGNLCPDLVLTVTDAGHTYWSGAASVQVSPTSLDDGAGGAQWPGTSPGPAGSNTFTITVTKGANFNTDSADQGQSCGFDLLFTQQSV